MRRLALAILMSTTVMFAAPVQASDRLTDIESAFVVASAASAMVIGFCDAHAVKDGVLKLADRLGTDEKLLDATRAALQVTMDMPYERSSLIPTVTQLFTGTANGVAVEIQENKKKACSKWIDALRKMGTIE